VTLKPGVGVVKVPIQ